MAHFAELDENNIVLRVIVVANKDIIDETGAENESVGIVFCQNLLGGFWKQTSYNGNFRKNFAGIGYSYDSERDAFLPPKIFNSWVIDEETCKWVAPIPMPMPINENGEEISYVWNENTLSWDSFGPYPNDI